MRVAREVEVSRIFPPKESSEDTVTTTIRVPKSLAQAVDQIVDAEKRHDCPRRALQRDADDVARHHAGIAQAPGQHA